MDRNDLKVSSNPDSSNTRGISTVMLCADDKTGPGGTGQDELEDIQDDVEIEDG